MWVILVQMWVEDNDALVLHAGLRPPCGATVSLSAIEKTVHLQSVAPHLPRAHLPIFLNIEGQCGVPQL